MTSARSANNSRLGYESASTNTSQSPVAAEAPLLRAREIWFTGSNTTVASAARAFSAVRSVELLSQTMISHCQPSEEKAAVAALILRSERAMNFSSLYAGTMIEIFTRAFGNARPRKSQRPTDRKSTRLNSSHSQISYAVFCLKKKKSRTYAGATLYHPL